MTEFDPVEFGRSIGAMIREAVEPLKSENAELRKEIEALKAREPDRIETIVESPPVEIDVSDVVNELLASGEIKQLVGLEVASYLTENPPPPGRDGKDGEKGDPGQDAPPVEIDVADVVKELLASEGIRPLVGLEVEAYLRENPPPAGKDGRDGAKGDPGEPGKSVTLDDVSVFLEAAVAKHVLDFERRASEKLDRAIERIPVPKDGRDGVDLTELSLDYDCERTVTVKGRTGTVTKRVPVPLWRGYWSPGVVAEKGDILTHNGTAYIAIVDNPKCEPGVGKYDHEWKVFARKGRDGKDGRNGIDKTKSVDLKKDKPGNDDA